VELQRVIRFAADEEIPSIVDYATDALFHLKQSGPPESPAERALAKSEGKPVSSPSNRASRVAPPPPMNSPPPGSKGFKKSQAAQ